MRFLADTHAFLWWLDDDPRLGAGARDRMADPRSTVWISAASIWEIAIKSQLGKLSVDADLSQEIGENGFLELPMTARHAAAAGALPPHHRDPFDRMLIAQSRLEDLRILSRDSVLGLYDAQTVWD